MLITMDGNNSLKRLRRNVSGENMTKAPRGERIDSRLPRGNYYISREDVDKWSRQRVEQEVAVSPNFNLLSNRFSLLSGT